VAIQVVAIQGIMLGLLPILRSWGHLDAGIWVVGLSGVVFKGILLPWLMQTVLRRTDVQKETAPYVGFGSSILVGVVLLVLAGWLAVNLQLPSKASPVLTATSMFLVLVGLFLMMSRRKAIMLALAYLVMENGVYSLGVSISLDFPFIVELGILLDVFVGVFLMGNLLFHLDRELQHTDIDKMTELSELQSESDIPGESK
jgi:hydrogenase-4 component E